MSDGSWFSPDRRVGAPAERQYPEHEAWTLTKPGHLACARVRPYPHGLELRIEVDGSLIVSQLFRTGVTPLEDAIREHRQAFQERGWTVPE